MKTKKLIILSIISIMLTSCFSENYRIITRVERDGSCTKEIDLIANSIPDDFPYDLSSGWKISTDTVVDQYHSRKTKNYIKISKRFESVDNLSADLLHDKIFPNPKESLKKRFKWFYTYYDFEAVYPEVTDKGHVPMDKYLNKAEQRFYLQGDMSDYKGMNGYELKIKLDDIESQFMKWYTRSAYEEALDVILLYAGNDYHSQFTAIKDTLYSINEKQINEVIEINDICAMLDRHSANHQFSMLYAKNGAEIDKLFKERTKLTDELQKYSIQYELTLPGKIMASNTDLQNDGALAWNINLFRFLNDDYTLFAQSRAVNVWAFAVTLLLMVFAVYSLKKYFY